MKKVASALNELGFRKDGKYFSHPDCEYFIEFVTPPVSIGDEPVHIFEYHRTSFGTIKMLTPTDSVKDRLAGFYHWGDRQSLDQAITLCKEASQEIDIQEIKRWSNNENYSHKFELFLKELKKSFTSSFYQEDSMLL